MNICLISREFPPFYGGGIGTYSRAWAGVLAAAGHRVLVITVTHDGRERRETDATGFELLRLPLVRGEDWSAPDPAIDTPESRAAFHTFSPVSVFAMQIAQRLPALHEEFRFDIIEAPDTGALAWFHLNARRIGAIEGAASPPVIIHVHSPSAWINRWNRTPAAGRRDLELLSMERDCARWANGLVAPSQAIAAEAAAIWDIDEARIAVIPYPLGDLQPLAATAARDGRARPPSEARTVLYTGRMEPRKGVHTLIRAAAQFGGDPFTLTLIGQDMPDPDGPGALAANQIGHLPPAARARVTLLGRMPPADLPPLRAAADFIAIPSPHDNFPHTCMEAMAAGIPVIAADAGGLAEMIRDGVDGLLFAPADERACAEAIRRALALPRDQAAAMGRAAAQRILELCGNDPVLSRRVAHFHRVAQEPRRAAQPGAAPTIITTGAPTDSGVSALTAALQSRAALDYACAWAIRGDHVLALSTPDPSTLAYTPPDVGPIAASPRAAEFLAIQGLISPHSDGHRARSTRDCLIALCKAFPDAGAVLPHVLGRVAPAPPPPPPSPPPPTPVTNEAVALRRELDTIKSSRGWALLQRVYRVLHVLKGRGR